MHKYNASVNNTTLYLYTKIVYFALTKYTFFVYK